MQVACMSPDPSHVGHFVIHCILANLERRPFRGRLIINYAYSTFGALGVEPGCDSKPRYSICRIGLGAGQFCGTATKQLILEEKQSYAVTLHDCRGCLPSDQRCRPALVASVQ